ncbi:replication endonuclease [Salinimonas lutimaris]|uniref:replication endonuclease n=1 Tax=Salinimonas lutimaris TaxID=914153 RepID=UPI0010BF7B7B|nr:replication endonuclease [Salinimonas lutimaris]
MRRFKESELSKTLDLMGGFMGDFYRSLHVDDRIFVKGLISHFPAEVQRILADRYQAFDKPFNANSYIRDMTGKLNALLPAKLIPYFNAGENELRELAKENARRCKRFELNHIRQQHKLPEKSENPVNGIQFPLTASARFVNGFGIAAPEESNSVTLTGVLRRMQDEYWWLRQLRKVISRKRETVLIHLGQVNSRKGKYCSDYTVQFRLIQKELQREMLENLIIVNELNESFSLAELSDKNVSNPVNRKNELMTRMSGFEKLSKEAGHKAIFVTITCPSRFHNTYAKSGDPNPKWDGSTPRDAQDYLNNIWRRIRAELDRRSIQQYGFRIAEPQHDGTPHWHMLLFINPIHSDTFKSVIKDYALQEDGDEAGAQENRCDFKDIDYSRGSATGYIAKYVSKNVNGEQLDSDIDGGDAIHAAQRVEAWASCWGIRQFQQIGNGSVTVWRELRRLKQLVGLSETFDAIYEAADSGDWAKFVELMGGVFCKRNDQPIRPLYQEKVNEETGEVKQSYFDGVVTLALKGVQYADKEVITRVYEWRIEHQSKRAA